MRSFLKLSLVIIALYLSPSSALQSSDSGTLKQAHNMAMHAVMACGDEKVQEIDDGVSDAYTIAILLASECNLEYQHHIELFSSTLENDNKVDEFKEQINSDAFTVLVFLPIVLQHREHLRKNEKLKGGQSLTVPTKIISYR